MSKMNINILSQGLTPDIGNSVGKAIMDFLSSDQYHTFTAISAFASPAGIVGLSPFFELAKANFKSLNIIVGVDQKGTSKEALEAIIDLDINSYIFYHVSFPIFHPKIYLFEGEYVSQLIIGSSNLTTQGLFLNVEASIRLELFQDIETDVQLIKDLKVQFSGIFDFSHPNLQKITPELIQQLVDEKIVPDETERKRNEIKEKLFEDDSIVRVLREIFPKIQIPAIPKDFKRIRKVKSKSEEVVVQVPESSSEEVVVQVPESSDYARELHGEFILMWRRRKLPSSSVEVALSDNTNITGGLRLVQDKFEVNGSIIDQTTYFRDVVFCDLDWTVENKFPFREIAVGNFQVTIFGENLGVFQLTVRHKPSGAANQGNYTTLISWGEIKSVIRDRNLTGYMLNLYRLTDSTNNFKLEIVESNVGGE